MLTEPRPTDLSAGLRLWRQRRRVSQLELAIRAGTGTAGRGRCVVPGVRRTAGVGGIMLQRVEL